MSFYWRWVLIRTAAAVLVCLALNVLSQMVLPHFPPVRSRVLGPIYGIGTVVTIVMAEGIVLRARFPQLSLLMYLVCRAIPYHVGKLGGFLTTYARAESSQPALPFEPTAAVVSPVEWLGLIFGVPILFLLLCVPGLIAWLALRKHAVGFRQWVIWHGVASFVTLVSFGLLDSWARSYLNWYGDTTTLSLVLRMSSLWIIAHQLTYALISGIGVARLRPLPEATP